MHCIGIFQVFTKAGVNWYQVFMKAGVNWSKNKPALAKYQNYTEVFDSVVVHGGEKESPESFEVAAYVLYCLLHILAMGECRRTTKKTSPMPLPCTLSHTVLISNPSSAITYFAAICSQAMCWLSSVKVQDNPRSRTDVVHLRIIDCFSLRFEVIRKKKKGVCAKKLCRPVAVLCVYLFFANSIYTTLEGSSHRQLFV